jgi:translation initiation factor IF-3
MTRNAPEREPTGPRINDAIRAREIRLIDETGQNVGVVNRQDAMDRALAAGMDLVEISPDAAPPVCKILDYGKFKYEQSKQKKSDKPKKREKEVKFRVNIDPHDYAIKMMHAEDFLAHGFKVRIQLQFKGRQMAHKELGFDLMEKVKIDLSGMAHIDLEPKLNNRNILMMVSPLPAEKQRRKFRKDGEIVDLTEADAAMEAYDDDDDDDEDYDHDEEDDDSSDSDDAGEAGDSGDDDAK